MRMAQREHKENRDAGLKKAIEEQEKQARESDDPKVVKKAAAAAETVLCKCQTQELYTWIKQVFKPGTGSRLQ